MQLVPLEASDLAQIRAWSDAHAPALVEAPDAARPVFAWMVRLRDNTPVGWVELFNVDQTNLKAEIGIGIYERRGRGLAFFAGRMAVREAFRLGLHRIYSRIPEGNAMSIKLVQKAGFVREGIERAAVFRNGRYEDVHVYATLNRGDDACRSERSSAV